MATGDKMKKNTKSQSKRKAADNRKRTASLKNTAATRATKIKAYKMKVLIDDVKGTALTRPDEFIAQVESLLSMYSERMKGVGISALGENGNKVFPLIESIGSDLDDFKETIEPIRQRANAYIAKATNDGFDRLEDQGTDIVLDAQDILERYSELYLLSHQSLLNIEH